MFKKLIVFLISLTLLATVACASQPQIIEVTRQVPETVVITQLVTVMVTPEPSSTPTPEPITSTPSPTETTVILQPATPTPIEYYYPIANCAASRLHVGDLARVTYGGGPNAIRFSSDVHSPINVIGYAQEGELLEIIDGPECSYGYIVWRVQNENGVGYTPETDGNSWFLEPAPQQ